MKSSILPIGLCIGALTALGAELTITSFDRSGNLAWTNSYPVVKARYALEIAQNPAGPWDVYEFVTNQTSLIIDDYLLEYPHVFFRLWTDPPPETNIFNYKGFDGQGITVVTGRLDLVFYFDDHVLGNWALQRVGNSTNDIGPQIGQGKLTGFVDTSTGILGIGLTPPGRIDAVLLDGPVGGYQTNGSWLYTNYTGNWRYTGDWPPYLISAGSFIATKQPKEN